MALTTDLSDASVPTSAHALQVEKAIRAYQQKQSEERAKQDLVVWGSLGVLSLAGMAIGYCWNSLSSNRKTDDDEDSESSDDELDSDELLEDDLLAMEAGALVGRRVKRNIIWERERLASQYFWGEKRLDIKK
jgi:hypothetical protein